MTFKSYLPSILLSSLKYKYFKTRTPILLSISITSKCNLRCTYCYSYKDNQNAKELEYEEIVRIIDEFYLLGTRIVMLQGGEPMLHKRIDDLIRYVKSKNMYCSVTTNSINFEKHLDAAKLLDQVQLSIDGNREITDAQRGKGVYDSVEKAMQLCSEHGIPFHLHAVITGKSTEENTIAPLTELAKRYYTYLNFCIPDPEGPAGPEVLPVDKHIRGIFRLLREKKETGMPTNNSFASFDAIVDWGNKFAYGYYINSDDKENKRLYPKCVLGDLIAWLDTTGTLHPCAVKFGEEGFGYSIKEYGIRGAWAKLEKVPCHFCGRSTEFNKLFGLSIEPLVNALKFIVRRKKTAAVY